MFPLCDKFGFRFSVESEQLLVQSFDTACKKSKCTQTSRGLGCCLKGEVKLSQWLRVTIPAQCSALPQPHKKAGVWNGVWMHLRSTGQLLYSKIIQPLTVLEWAGMSMKALSFLGHIQMIVYLCCGPARNRRLHATISGLNPSTALERRIASYFGHHLVSGLPACQRTACLPLCCTKGYNASGEQTAGDVHSFGDARITLFAQLCVYKKWDKFCATSAESTSLKV